MTTVEIPTFLYWVYVGMGYVFWGTLLWMIARYLRDFFRRRRTRVYIVRVGFADLVHQKLGLRFKNELEDGTVIYGSSISESKEKVELYIMDRDNLPLRFIQLHIVDENGN